MKTHTLDAQKRTISGRKVKNLRKSGLIPATVYGKGVTSFSIQLNGKTFEKIVKEAGETGLLSLTVDGSSHPVLISHIQKHPVTWEVVHIEFREVSLKEKVKSKIPVEIVGEPVAVKEKVGTLLTLLNDIEIEALPTDLPEKFEVDVNKLASVNDTIFVKDLTIPSTIKVLTDPEQIIVKIGELLAPEPEPTPVAPAEGEGAPTEGGETPKEGETEEKKEEGKPSETTPSEKKEEKK